MNALLKACLVDGYGEKQAAGWTHTVIDAASSQYAFSQGAAAGKAVRHLYVSDPEHYQTNIVACSGFTVGATPVLSNSFGSYAITTPSVILKANQTVVGGVAEWFMVADSRRFAIMVKRENWAGFGWDVAFVGDIDSPYGGDKGAFSIFGRSTADTNMIIGGAPDAIYFYRGYCFGEVNGTASPSAYSSAALLTGENYNGKHGFNGVVLSPRVCTLASAYRGLQPFLWVAVNDYYAVSPYIFNDGAEITTEDGRVFRYIRNGLSPTSTRLFVQVGGFDY
jgi:hypothetical protein